MSDDLDRRLEGLYRSLDVPARRLEARWRTRREPRPVAGRWIGAGAAAAAAILLIVLSLRPEEKAPAVAVAPPPPATSLPEAPPPRPLPPPAPAPVAEVPPAPPAPPPPAPAPRPPAPPPEAAPAPPPPPAPKTDPPAPTLAARASMPIREIEGSFELGDRSYRGKQKDVPLEAGERLRAGSRVRMALSDDRIVLLAPNTLLELRPEEKRLTLSLERGELIADLAGPGPELRVIAKACEITPLGTAFGVKLENQKVLVVVERGRVEVKSARARAQLRAAESLQASEDGTLGTPAAADFRGWAWSRAARAPELTLLSDKFASPERAEAVHRASEKPPLFEVPARGVLTIVCRADRPCRLKVQLFAADARATYKVEPGLLRGAAWRTLTIPFEDFAATDKSRARLAPGSPITDLLLMPIDDEEKAAVWVESIRVTELR